MIEFDIFDEDNRWDNMFLELINAELEEEVQSLDDQLQDALYTIDQYTIKLNNLYLKFDNAKGIIRWLMNDVGDDFLEPPDRDILEDFLLTLEKEL